MAAVLDLIVQRVIEVLQSLPSIPLWMALAAIMPVTWSPILIYFGITLILGLLDWTGLARAVRSKLLSLREEDYVLAAQLMGARSSRIIGRHLIPGFMSHLIASATIAIPGMILGETALSFLGLGLRPPITSWGILLTEARSVNVIAFYPWLLYPMMPVILVILAFNFMGDGLAGRSRSVSVDEGGRPAKQACQSLVSMRYFNPHLKTLTAAPPLIRPFGPPSPRKRGEGTLSSRISPIANVVETNRQRRRKESLRCGRAMRGATSCKFMLRRTRRSTLIALI